MIVKSECDDSLGAYVNLVFPVLEILESHDGHLRVEGSEGSLLYQERLLNCLGPLHGLRKLRMLLAPSPETLATDANLHGVAGEGGGSDRLGHELHVAPLSEIAGNDYNLNIPRYVETFEEEEPVDLAVVTTELKKLEKGMAKTDQTIRDFCAELGIETPV